jgi:hypothetical protein
MFMAHINQTSYIAPPPIRTQKITMRQARLINGLLHLFRQNPRRPALPYFSKQKTASQNAALLDKKISMR